MAVSRPPVPALELYSGLGGFAAAAGDAVRIRAAIDLDRDAVAVSRRNFDHPHRIRTLESVAPRELKELGARLWWLSPPCQPFTRRGKRRDLRDPRNASLLALLETIRRVRPRHLALENVPPFRESETRSRLLEVLTSGGYEVRETSLCPTELGIPNRRRRYYLVASRGSLEPLVPPSGNEARRLADYLRPEAADDPKLRVDPELLERYDRAVDRVDPGDPAAVASTFTSAYGRSPVRSGSYLLCADGGWRRFSPREVLSLLGFPPEYELPGSLSLRRAWSLVGNSLSLPAVRRMLSSIRELSMARSPG
ncbi:MAG: DNA cytosine methyltransferase [Thermoanaerobaculia bacterium]|nr:DNA cytosine methyltransferase [Thermoanaerobaculia bacterium]